MDLAKVLDGMFDTDSDDLPEGVRREVARRLFPLRWDDLGPEHRQTLALAADGEASDQEDEFGRHWRLYAERAELLRQVSEWWQVATPTATDRAIQEDRIAALRAQIEKIDQIIDGPARAPEGVSTVAPEDAEDWALEPRTRQRRADAITLDIEAALAELGANASPRDVMAYLKGLVGKPGASIVDVAPDGVIWRRLSGRLEKMTERVLADRLTRLRKRAMHSLTR